MSLFSVSRPTTYETGKSTKYQPSIYTIQNISTLEKYIIKPEYNIIEIKYKVKINKVEQILRDACNKIKFVICCAQYIQNTNEILNNYFDKNEIELIKKVVDRHSGRIDTLDKNIMIRHRDVGSLQNFINNFESKFKGVTNEDDELNFLIEFIYRNNNFREFCNNVVFNELKDILFYLIYDFEAYAKVIIKDMLIPPKEYFDNESKLFNTYKNNFHIKDKIKQVKHELKTFKPNFDNIRELQEIEHCQHALWSMLKENLQKDKELFEEVMKTEKKHYDTNWELEGGPFKCQKRKDKLDELIAGNVAAEKAKLEIKQTLYNQIKEMMTNYQKHMAEKNDKKRDLTEKLKLLKADLVANQKIYLVQDEIYVQLKNEKKQYEQEMWERKLYEIQCNIAARKIQKYFRTYLRILTKIDAKALPKLPRKGKKKRV